MESKGKRNHTPTLQTGWLYAGLGFQGHQATHTCKLKDGVVCSSEESGLSQGELQQARGGDTEIREAGNWLGCQCGLVFATVYASIRNFRGRKPRVDMYYKGNLSYCLTRDELGSPTMTICMLQKPRADDCPVLRSDGQQSQCGDIRGLSGECCSLVQV